MWVWVGWCGGGVVVVVVVVVVVWWCGGVGVRAYQSPFPRLGSTPPVIINIILGRSGCHLLK